MFAGALKLSGTSRHKELAKAADQFEVITYHMAGNCGRRKLE